MTTRELIESLPEKVRTKVEYFREQRTSFTRSLNYAAMRSDADEERFYYKHLEELKIKWSAYCSAMRDAGVVDEAGRKILFIYGTILNGTDQSRAVYDEA